MNAKEIVNVGKTFLIKHLPTITMGAGIAGFITTVILTADRAPKAKAALNKAAWTEEGYPPKELSVVEKAKIVVPIVWPIALSGTASIACFIFANSMNLKRNAAALAAYQISESSLKNLKEAALKTVGEKKTEEILDAKDREAVKASPQVVIIGEGEQKCMDGTTGVCFSANKNKIERAIIDVNYMIIDTESACINDLYENLGIPDNMWPEMGGRFGWYTGPGSKSEKLEPRWSSTIDANGNTVLVFTYDFTEFPWT